MRAAETPIALPPTLAAKLCASAPQASGIDPGQIVSPEAVESVEKHGGEGIAR